jgi:hypothetical protein
MQSRIFYRGLWPILALLALAALAGWTTQAKAQPVHQTTSILLADGPVHPTTSQPAKLGAAQIATDEHEINLAALGIRPISVRPGQAPPANSPDSGAMGISNAWMSVSPEVISTTTGVAGTLASGFTIGEPVGYYLNGVLAGTFTVGSSGVLRIAITAGSTEGYLTVEARGTTSGKRTGGVIEILNNAPQVPGVSVGPHAIASGSPFRIYAVGYPASSTVQVALDNGAATAYPTDANGRLALNFTSITGPTGPVVLNVYRTGVAGSMSGESFEIRPDAGTGDANPSRGLMDRAVINATTGGRFSFSGDGFQPNEPVTLSGCASGATTATANGSAIAPLSVPSSASPQVYKCTITGGNSGYVAYGAILADANATNIPSGIVSPSTTIADGNGLIVAIDRFPGNQTGTIYVDGVASTVFTTTVDGWDTELITKPAALGIHAVLAVADSGQIAIMPLWINAPALTVTPTGTASATVTATATGPTGTPTLTSTATQTQVPTVTTTPTLTSIIPTITITVLPSVTLTLVPPTTTATQTATVTATACPTYNFSDVSPSDYFYTPVQYLACHGVISGYSDGTFRPFNNTTRGQMAKIVALGFALPLTTPAAGGQTYQDVPPTDTFYAYIETLAARSIAGGYACGGTNPQTLTPEPCVLPNNRPYYRPGNFITRGQLVKLVVIAASQQLGWDILNPPAPTFSDVPAGSTFYEYIETAVCHGVINGYSDGTFKPSNNAFRGQIAKIVYLSVTGSAPNCVNPTVTATPTP